MNDTEEVDPHLWRTQLLARPEGGWDLGVDGMPLASTSEPLTNSQAHDWARAEMGEGAVRFEPVVFDRYAEPALREGRSIDWVATPGPLRREMQAERDEEVEL